MTPNRIVVLILALDIFVLVPIGLATIWYGVGGDVAYWDDGERLAVVGLGVIVTVMFLGVGIGIARFNILGLPRVRIDGAGLWIGETGFGWDELGEVGGAAVYGVPYLVVATTDASARRLGVVNRVSMRFGPALPDGRRFLWVTEAQLGIAVKLALRGVPHDRLAGSHR